jgi:isopentenyl-diphosphate delta-isomerase
LSEGAFDRFAVVSSDTDQLILVNSQDEEIGFDDKLSCHDGQGKLHRAFSVLLFNEKRELLIQRRAPGKRLWGGYWSNSCCSHPRVGETMDEAAKRRVLEELGLSVSDLTFLYKFEYHAQFGDVGAEHELCTVFIGRADLDPVVNENEISQWRYIGASALEAELEANPEHYTPWFKMEWQQITRVFASELDALF